LEASLSVEELLATLKAIYNREDRNNRFQAALQGVDLDEKSDDEELVSDVRTLTGYSASKAGFGIGLGLGYVEE
jgi:hypothetical protein